MARPNSTDRLVRLLALPVWVAANPNISLQQVADHFGVSVEVIRQDISTLWVCGPRDGLPDELVDFDALAFEKGYLRLTHSLGLEHPLRITNEEAISLRLALRVLLNVLQDDPVASAQLNSADQALKYFLDAQPAASASTPTANTALTDKPDAQTVLVAIRTALTDKKQMRLEYVSATDEFSVRTVEPQRLVSNGSYLYLHAWCLSSQDTRIFRTDRILNATVLDTAACAPPHAAAATAKAGETCVLYLTSGGKWVSEQIPCESVTREADDTIKVVVHGRDRNWLLRLILSCGRNLVKVQPQSLAVQAGELARAALQNIEDFA